jgi:hypothetical protein
MALAELIGQRVQPHARVVLDRLGRRAVARPAAQGFDRTASQHMHQRQRRAVLVREACRTIDRVARAGRQIGGSDDGSECAHRGF